MKVSEKGLDLIRRYEGFRAEAYRCPGGFWTIGYGHCAPDVQKGMTITLERAEELLREDILSVEKLLNFLKLKVNQNQFDALASFAFNVGSGNFRRSYLLEMVLHKPSSKDIRAEFARWNKSNFRVLPGLTRRRKEEADLYFTPV